jgi:hypothetical protein
MQPKTIKLTKPQTKPNKTNFNKMNALQTNISLYIPHVYTNYTKEKITDVFENRLKIGKINSIDLVAKLGKNDKTFNAAYIHFEYWYNNEDAIALQEKVLNANQDAKIYYEEPWFWIVLENKSKKVVPGDRKQRIVLDDFQRPASPETPPPVELQIPSKPIKEVNNNLFDITNAVKNLNTEFVSEEFEISTMQEMLAEDVDQCVIDFIQNIENELNEDDMLITIDVRYVQGLEEQLANANNQMLMLQSMLQQQQYYQQQWIGYNPMTMY